MTVANTSSSAGPYVGNGSTKSYAFGFKALTTAEVGVYLNNVKQTVGYSVALNVGTAGGTVTFTAAPAVGVVINLYTDPLFTQSVDLEDGPFSPDVVEEGLDRAAIRDLAILRIANAAYALAQSASGGGLDAEAVRDLLGSTLVQGAGVSIAVDDTNDIITISASGATDPEVVRDTIANALVQGPNVTIAVDDTANTITISSTGGGVTDPEVVRDVIGAALVAGTAVTITVNDGADTITVAVDQSALKPTSEIIIPVGNQTDAVTAGAGKITFRSPAAMTLSDVRASLKTAQNSGSILTVDVNESGVSVLSTKLTIDNGAKTSTTAAAPRVISDPSIADDAEITIDVDQVGDGTAVGLVVTLIWKRT